MGKKITLALLLILVLGGALLQNIYVRKETQELSHSLEQIKAALDTGDYLAAAGAADAFSDSWEQKKQLFEALFEHAEIDIISSSAKSIKSYCDGEEKAEALSAVEQTAYYIRHIMEIDCIRWENIF